MKKVHYKVLLVICSVVAIAALFLPVIRLQDALYGVKGTGLSIIDFMGGNLRTGIITAITFDARMIQLTQVLLIAVFALQFISGLSAFKGRLMPYAYFFTSLLSIFTGAYIWYSCFKAANNYMGMLAVTADVGTYILFLVGILEFFFLVKWGFLREKSY